MTMSDTASSPENNFYHLIRALEARAEFDELCRSVGIVVDAKGLRSKMSQLAWHFDGTWMLKKLDEHHVSSKVKERLITLSKEYFYNECRSNAAA